MKMTSNCRQPQQWRWPKNEDDLKKEDDLKNEGNHKIEDDLKNEDIKNENTLRNEDDLKNWPSPEKNVCLPPLRYLPEIFVDDFSPQHRNWC